MESFLTVLISVYFVMVVAEFGDKTNLIALSLMGKNPPYYVAFFSTVGIAISTVFSVAIGGILGASLPLEFIRYPAALVFIWLGVSALREEANHDDLDDDLEGAKEEKNGDPFYRIMYLVALAELGDKSQIFAITAAAASFPLAET